MLGLGFETNVSAATPAVAAGGRHSMVLTSDGSLYGWGDSEDGGVGVGPSNATGCAHSQNFYYSPVLVRGSSFATAIAASTMNSIAICGGSLCTWGANDRGQNGDGGRCFSGFPKTIFISPVSVSTAGGSYSAAALGDGSVSTWGANVAGLGFTAAQDVLTPTTVPGISGVTSVVTGAGHTLALKGDGTVLSWGLNGSGQLGTGGTATRVSPVTIPGLSGITAVAANGDLSMALQTGGNVWVWGRFLSDGSSDAIKTTPQLVPGLGSVIRIAAGPGHAMALKADGTVWTWGLNPNGEVGDGTKTPRTSPVQVMSGATAIAAGDMHSLAIGTDFAVRSWGSNFQEALGLGNGVVESLVPALVPVYVSQPPAPANDNFANRAMLTGASGSVSGTLAGATREAGEPQEGGSASSISIWYRWVAPASGQVTLTPSGNVTVGAEIYTGNVVSGLTRVGTGLFQAQAGQEYQIVLFSGSGKYGTAALSWSLNTAAAADLRVTMTANPTTAFSNSVIAFQAVVSNAGPNTATGVVLSDPLPANTQVDGALPPDCAFQATTVVCQLGTITSGGTANVTIKLKPTAAPQSMVNTVTVTSQVPDPSSGDSSASVTVPVSAQTSSQDADIPTAPEWAMIILALLLATSILVQRQRSH